MVYQCFCVINVRWTFIILVCLMILLFTFHEFDFCPLGLWPWRCSGSKHRQCQPWTSPLVTQDPFRAFVSCQLLPWPWSQSFSVRISPCPPAIRRILRRLYDAFHFCSKSVYVVIRFCTKVERFPFWNPPRMDSRQRRLSLIMASHKSNGTSPSLYVLFEKILFNLFSAKSNCTRGTYNTFLSSNKPSAYGSLSMTLFCRAWKSLSTCILGFSTHKSCSRRDQILSNFCF